MNRPTTDGSLRPWRAASARQLDARLGPSDDSGFTIVESLVAMMLVLLFFVTFTTSVVGALRGSRDTRLTQTATVIVTDHLEAVRGLGWEEIAMTGVDESAPMLDATASSLLAADAGLEEDEALVSSAWGLVVPKTVETADNTEYTVWTYVTEAPRDLKRVTVLVVWTYTDNLRTHRSSTLLAEPAGG